MNSRNHVAVGTESMLLCMTFLSVQDQVGAAESGAEERERAGLGATLAQTWRGRTAEPEANGWLERGFPP